MTAISNSELADALEKVVHLLRPPEPCKSWIVWFETATLDGAPYYTYRMGEGNCDTAEEAIQKATDHLPNFLNPDEFYIRSVVAVRATDATEFDGFRFRRMPQFQVR